MRAILVFPTMLFLINNLCLQSQEFPTPKPLPEHKILANEAGTWDCAVKMYLSGPNNSPTEFTGIEENKLVGDGLFLSTKFTCPMGNRVFKGQGLMGYHPGKNSYTGTFVNNFTISPAQTTGTYNAQTRTMTQSSEVYDQSTGKTLQQKQITTWENDSAKHFTIFLVVDSGDEKVDVKVMEMSAKKR